MQRIVDIFYSHLVADRFKGKRGAVEAMVATSGGAGSQGKAMEGVGAEERKEATKGWGKIKMAVGDDNMLSEHRGEGATNFANGVSSLKSKLMMAKLKAEELVDNEEVKENDDESENEEPPSWVEAKDHPVFKKFFSMVAVIGETSVKKRMDALNFDSSVISIASASFNSTPLILELPSICIK